MEARPLYLCWCWEWRLQCRCCYPGWTSLPVDWFEPSVVGLGELRSSVMNDTNIGYWCISSTASIHSKPTHYRNAGLKTLFLTSECNGHPHTTLCRDGEGEGSGMMGTVVRSPSIIVRTLSGISVALVHWSCQLLSFAIRMSLACSGIKDNKGKHVKSLQRFSITMVTQQIVPSEAADYKVVAAVLNRSEDRNVKLTPPHPQTE